jgi:hypothetical protein
VSGLVKCVLDVNVVLSYKVSDCRELGRPTQE